LLNQPHQQKKAIVAQRNERRQLPSADLTETPYSWCHEIQNGPPGDLFAELGSPWHSLVRTFVLPIPGASCVWLAPSSWVLTTSWRSGVVCLAGLFQLGFNDLLAFGRCLSEAVGHFAIAAL
jgi:hypothetical protein